MKKGKQVSLRQARLIGDCLYLDWAQVDLEEFRQGLMGYRRQRGVGSISGYPAVVQAGKTVMEHMQQFPDYFVRLARLRAEARAHTGGKKIAPREQTP